MVSAPTSPEIRGGDQTSGATGERQAANRQGAGLQEQAADIGIPGRIRVQARQVPEAVPNGGLEEEPDGREGRNGPVR